MRIAYLDMSDTSQQCPHAWRLISTPRRTCERSTSPNTGCDSVIFPTHGLPYSHVCGRVIGYQYGYPNAFTPLHDNRSLTIDGYYVDGVSITHGAPGSRQHVWTFTVGSSSGSCPCSTTQIVCPCSTTQIVPPYVGQDYFCESGMSGGQWPVFHTDPLWNGQDCWRQHIACECTFNSPPWFCKQLSQATTDDIEVRICGRGPGADLYADTPLEVIELYTH